MTNEVQELKNVSSAGKSNGSEICQSLLERDVHQAFRKGQETSDMLAFALFEIIDKQSNRVRQYQTLELKVIEDLKRAVAPYEPSEAFNTVMDTYLTPYDWKTICKATLSGGNYLLWGSE